MRFALLSLAAIAVLFSSVQAVPEDIQNKVVDSNVNDARVNTANDKSTDINGNNFGFGSHAESRSRNCECVNDVCNCTEEVRVLQ